MGNTNLATLAVATIVALTVGVSGAVADVIQERQSLMKEVVAPNVKRAGEMVKGEQPYDADEAAAAMRAVSQVPAKFLALLDEGTSAEDSDDSGASPAIWEDRGEFESRFEALRKASLAAEDSADAGLDSFKAAFGDVASQCRGCHQQFRIRR